MKTFAAMKSAVVLMASIMALGGCASTPAAAKAESPKSAIAAVLAERAKIKSAEGSSGLLTKEQLAELLSLNAPDCPAEFRSAWFDYLIAMQNLSTRVERVAAVAAAAGKPVADLPTLIKFAESNSAAGLYLLDALKQVDETWGRTEREAMNYGIMPQR